MKRLICLLSILLTAIPSQGQNIGIVSKTDSVKIFQLGVGSVAKRNAAVQLGIMSNIASDLRGVQLADFSNIAGKKARGFQLAGINNIATSGNGLVQLSSVANTSCGAFSGVQMGMYNYADTLASGVQIGLINISRAKERGLQIGIINISPNSKLSLMMGYGSRTKFNSSLLIDNDSYYNILGIGTHYWGLDERFSGAINYRIGKYVWEKGRFRLGLDAGISHIESFGHGSEANPTGKHYFGLEGRAMLQFKLWEHLGLYYAQGYEQHWRYRDLKENHGGLTSEIGVYIPIFQFKNKAATDQLLLDADLPALTGAEALVPAKRPKPWLAAAEVFGINAFVWSFDRFATNSDFARINIKTIHNNIKTGFVWDNDRLSTNHFAHPYHGNLYFNSARSNGLNFWQSLPYSIGGSLMWEVCAEIEPPALNDWIATSLAGACIGEIAHRSSAIILDDSKTGWARFGREASAFLVNPIGGLNRIISGDAFKTRRDQYLYHDFEGTPLDMSISVGNRHLCDESKFFRGENNPYLQFYLEYGDAYDDTKTAPYDFFSLEVTAGLSSNQPLFSSVQLLGRLYEKTIDTGNDEAMASWGIYQHYNYYDSHPVKKGLNQTPFRLSETVSVGPGVSVLLPKTGIVDKLEQRFFVSAILLGASKSDYLSILNRDYNMGNGFSLKSKTFIEFAKTARLILNAKYYHIFTWKGYENRDLTDLDPHYYNTQGEKGKVRFVAVTPTIEIDLSGPLSLSMSASFYSRNTHYKYFQDVRTGTFEIRTGLCYHL